MTMKQNILNAVLFIGLLALLGYSGLIPTRDTEQGYESESPKNEAILSVQWGGLGQELIQAGVIDPERFEELHRSRGELNEYGKQLLYGESADIRISKENAGVLLNLLWALGLANKNPILEEGPMADARYGGAGRFASTGGWTLAQGDPSTGLGASAMEHYSRHAFLTLTDVEQELVEKVSKNIYRPCCDNPTHFPDCNHGMAMLGFLELMASQGKTEEEMYRAALALNRYWFPDNYAGIETYLENRGSGIESVDPRVLLGADFSSGSGYRRILTQITPPAEQGGGSCGV